jgi:DNA-binding transcriptional LysR family regulator
MNHAGQGVGPLLSALDWRENPTALPAMKVCLFSNPGCWKAGRHQKGPHRRCFKMSSLFRMAGETTGGVSSRYLTDFLTISRIGGHPQARATLGNPDLWFSAVAIKCFLALPLKNIIPERISGNRSNNDDRIRIRHRQVSRKPELQPQMDTLTRIRAFIDVVEAEGFSAAARKVGRSKALLSKYVRELEDDLGAHCCSTVQPGNSRSQRPGTPTTGPPPISSRKSTTSRIWSARARTDLKGRIRVSAPRTFADAAIGRSLIDFAAAHPDISLEVISDDRFVDLVEEGYDVAIRITKLEDSGLIARKLSAFSLIPCASPEFIEKHGPITHPSQLSGIPCIVDTNGRFLNNWRFDGPDGATVAVTVHGRLEVNSPLTAMRAAEAGLGVAVLPDFIFRERQPSGTLVPILEEYRSNDRGIYAIYPHRRYLPAKVRAFVDYLTQWFKAAH